MAAIKKKMLESTFMQIPELEFGVIRVHILSNTALYMNRMSKKAREQLLLPPIQTNRAGREATLKHNPPAEYNEAVYRCRDPKAPTLIHIPDGAFKGAMAQTALRIPGATKTEVGCLVQVVTPTIHLYGRPFLKMDIVRQGGINKTPDVRTRAYFPEWACAFDVEYLTSRIRQKDIANLLVASGKINGIGDGRAEKGKFNYGSFFVVDERNKDYQRIVKQQGRKVQVDAMSNPVAFDAETDELLQWFGEEIKRREREPEKRRRKSDGVALPPAAVINDITAEEADAEIGFS